MLVSILIPCYNAERWIASAIESALQQTYAPVEVIVMDDGSSDDSLAIISRFGDRIRCAQAPHRGGNAARNQLLDLAQGQWLQYLDADDYLLPTKIATQLRELEAPQRVDIAYSPVIHEYWRSGQAAAKEVLEIPPPHDPAALLARWRLPQTGAALWRREAIQSAGGWNVDQPCCQEHELYLRLLMRGGRFQFCPTPGAVYRHWSEATVCRRDPTLTIMHRLEILRRLHDYLDTTSKNTSLRRDAIAEGRYECARSLYPYQPHEAKAAAGEARRDHPYFRLPEQPAFPRSYRWAYRGLGFAWAEKLALWQRSWRAAGK